MWLKYYIWLYIIIQRLEIRYYEMEEFCKCVNVNMHCLMEFWQIKNTFSFKLRICVAYTMSVKNAYLKDTGQLLVMYNICNIDIIFKASTLLPNQRVPMDFYWKYLPQFQPPCLCWRMVGTVYFLLSGTTPFLPR